MGRAVRSRGARGFLVATSLAALVVAPVVASSATAQPGDGEPTEPPVTLDTTTTTTTTSTLPASTTSTTTSTTTTLPPEEDEVLEPPPVSDGAEIPDAAGPPAGGAAGAGPAVWTSPPPELVAAERRRIAGLIVDGGDALAVAGDIEAAAIAELDRLGAELAAAQRDVDLADRERREAEAVERRRRSTAERAESEAEDARDELQQVAIAMYVDPPQELATAAALSGEMDQRLAAEGLLAARSDVALRSARAAERADRRAARAAAAARRATEEAATADALAEERRAELRSRVADRAGRLLQVAATVEALRAEVGAAGFAGSRLLDRLLVEQVTRSGSVTVTIESGGRWSVEPEGFPAPSDIVRVPGTTIRVHRLIAADVAELVAAARADGVRLDGWGHRDALRQIELRRAHCGGSYALVFDAPAASCRPPTARPGRSMHERGLAVDFASCSTRSNPCYRWLAANAARYGLFNLPSEPWHWSTNGN